MRAISFIPLLLPAALASPFTFPSAPGRRHVTLTAQDGQPLVLTIAQTITKTSTTTRTMPTPPTLPGSSGPRRTGQPEDEMELRAIFAPTGTSDVAASESTSSTSSSTSSEDSDSDSDSNSDSDSDSNSDSIVEAAQTTPAPPANDPAVASALAEQGYSQMTYYTCLTQGATYTHCGWHVPVVKVSAAAEAAGRGWQRTGMAALGAAGAIVLGNFVFGG